MKKGEKREQKNIAIKEYFLLQLPKENEEFTLEELLSALEKTNTFALGDTIYGKKLSNLKQNEYYEFFLFFNENFGSFKEVE